MSSLIKRLRGLGPFGNFIATVVTLLTASWVVTLSVLGGLVVALWSSAVWFFQLPAVQVGIGVFLALLWTGVGVAVLVDRRKPRMVRPVPDYRYGLTPEGIIPALDPTNEDGWLGFGVQIRNYSQAPIRYTIEHFDLRFESRALPKLPFQPTGYLPRGGGKAIFPPWFKKDHVKEFFGKRVKGTVEIVIIYGHPEEPPARKLTIKAELTLELAAEGTPPLPIPAFGGNITEEIDEAI